MKGLDQVILLQCCIHTTLASLVTKWTSHQVKQSSWGNQEKVLLEQDRALHVACMNSKNFDRGLTAVQVDESNGQCWKGFPTCMKGSEAESENTTVYMQEYTMSYVGCTTKYLTEVASTNQNATPGNCAKTCLSQGKAISGVSGADCYCADGEMKEWEVTRRAADCDANCGGDATTKCGGAEAMSVYLTRKPGDVLYWQVHKYDKMDWVLSGTAPSLGTLLDQIRDGDLTSVYLSSNAAHPWLQIDLGSSQLVKAVIIREYAGSGNTQLQHLEVRVGDEDVSDSENDLNRICRNKLCYKVGKVGEEGMAVREDCVSPLNGRYISIQVHSLYHPRTKSLRVSEVDVELFCGHPEESDDDDFCPLQEQDDDCELAKIGQLEYLGCFQDSDSDRLQEHHLLGSPQSWIQVFTCANACRNQNVNYVYSGVQSVGNCHCGSVAPNPTRNTTGCAVKCPGDLTLSCGANLKSEIYLSHQATVLVQTDLSKTAWSASASGSKDSDRSPDKAIDGVADPNLSGFVSAQGQARPWLQIDFGSTYIVYDINLRSELEQDLYYALINLEVRVGDVDYAALGITGKKICVNRFCHRTGTAYSLTTRFQCSVTLSGRFLTLQKYRARHGASEQEEWTMLVREVDVRIFQ